MEKTILVGTGVSAGTPASPVNVPAGAIAVFNADTGVPVSPGDTLAQAPRIVIVRGVPGGEQPVISPVITGVNLKKWAGTAYEAPARHVMTIGFVGTGSLTVPVANNTEYDLIVKELSSNFEPFPTLVKSVISSFTGATGFSILDQFARLINVDAASRAWAEVLVNLAATALTNAATITTINGSPVVTVSDAADAPAVGSFLRIGGTAATFPVYKVLAVSGAQITLDRIYVNPAQTLGQTTATVAAATLNSAPAAEAVGLKLTAKEFGYVLAVSLDGGFNGAPVTATTAFKNGFGRGTQVQSREKQLQGNQAKYNNVWLVQPTLEQTDISKNYDSYQLAFTNEFESSAAPTSVDATIHEVVIFLDTTASTQKTALKAILNPWAASAGLPNVTV
jgi:hypothetical protein